KAEIIVLQVQRRARTIGIAVHETEDALVRALPHGVRGRNDAERLAIVFFDLVEDALTAAGRDLEFEETLRLEKAVVDGVAHRRAVDAHDTTADLEFEFGGNRAFRDFGDAYHESPSDSGQPSVDCPDPSQRQLFK